ncbi:MAG: hypothetical protein K6G16_05625 [Lachnospiraceae bacterium]|nr:hypothetical protein [Lachnospiraceae bacterium]
MDEEELYQELRKRKLHNILIGLAILAACLVGGYFLVEWLLTSMGLQAPAASFQEGGQTTAQEADTFSYGHVSVWTGEEGGDDLGLPLYEITVEDYRMAGLSHVGRPSATQERLSADLFVVVNDDPGNTVLSAMREKQVREQTADTFTVLVRDNPKAWQTLSVFDPVTVTITVPDALVEDAFVDNLVVYAVYKEQSPDNPGGLATLPVSVSEENGICYASFLVLDEYETEYALCAGD